MQVFVENPNTIVIDVDQGRQGRGIQNITYTEVSGQYFLIVTYTDGTTETLGPLVITGGAAFLLGGTTGSIPYQNAPNTTVFLPIGTQNQVVVAGATAPQYTSALTGLTVNNSAIGNTAPSTGAFTNLSASGTFALTGDQVQISEGGTGQTTANGAFNALAPSQTGNAGKYLKTNGTNTSWDQLDISTADITGVLPVVNGGTGASTASGARANLSAAVLGANNDITSMTGVTGGISSPDFVQFDTAATNTNAVGKVYWDASQGTLDLGLLGGNVVSRIGQSLVAYVTNAEAVTITKGQAVYLFSAQGDRATVKLAYNTSDTTSAKTLGIVAENIAAGQTGFVMCQGVLDGLNLAAFNPGDTLYLGPTPGSLTATKPSAPNHLVYIGVVERSNVGNGQLYIRVQNGYELEEIHDVQIVNPQNGQTIIYDATTSLWKNANLTAGTGVSVTNGPASVTIGNTGVLSFSGGTTGLTPATSTTGAVTLGGTLATTNGGTGLTSFTANRVFYASSTSAIGQSANLTFDGTTLTANNFTDSSLTSGRVTYATTGGNLTDSANLLFDGTTLTANALTTTSTVTLNGGTANGVAYLNGSKVLTSGSALTFNGSTLANNGAADGTNAITATGSSVGGFIALRPDGTNGQAIRIGGSGANAQVLRFLGASDAEFMRLTSTGLGIGTSSPTNRLSVDGNANITGNTTLGDASTDTVTVNGYMGVGGTNNARLLSLTGSGGFGGTTQIGVSSLPTGTSAGTVALIGASVLPTTATAAYTVSDVINFAAYGATKGAGSTITNLHGVYIADQTQGTNNYGITSLVSSGSNKWNIYASGTAANYFAGNVGIGTSSPATKLEVSGSAAVARISGTSGTVPQLSLSSVGVVNWSLRSNNDGASDFTIYQDSTQRLKIDSSGNLTLASPGTFTYSSGTANGVAYLNGSKVLTTGSALTFDGVGTLNQIASSGNAVSNLEGASTNNAVFRLRNTSTGALAGVYANNSKELVFEANGTAEQMRLTSTGLGIGTSAPGEKLQVAGAIRATGAVAANTTGGILAYQGSSTVMLGSWGADASTYGAIQFYQSNSTGTINRTGMLLDSSGNLKTVAVVSVGNATPATSGAGITFPATQSASSDANTLDDYEEGTWTPTQGAGLTVVGAFSSGGTYTKIGRQVTVNGFVGGATSVALTAGGIICGGLPFAAATSNGFGSGTNASFNLSIATLANAGSSNVYGCSAIAANANIYFSATYIV